MALRLLIVDDSALARRVLRSLIESDAGILVVGEASNGREALEQVARLRPDLVTMDVRMPIMDGVETTEKIMAFYPTPILVLTASLSSYDIDITFKMLGAGALDVLEKPSLTDQTALRQIRQDLIRRIKLLARVRVVTHLRGRRRTPGNDADSTALVTTKSTAPAVRPPTIIYPPVVVIGASTGGPRVVHQILAALPLNFGAAVLVVQHIAEGFGIGFVEWLNSGSRMPVSLAIEGQAITAGRVFVAPDHADLLIDANYTIHLSQRAILLPQPSVDITMQVVADVVGSRAVAVLLTGMGRDGARGMLRIRRSGGYTIAQDEATATIFGMPRAAIELQAADEVLPPSRIPLALVRLIEARTTGSTS